MKRHLLIISTLVMLGVLLALPTLLRNSAASAAIGGGGISVTMSLSPTSIQLGNWANITGTAVTDNNQSLVKNGWIIFDYLMDGNGKPVSCSTGGTYKMYDYRHLDRSNQGTYSSTIKTGAGSPFTTAGTVGFVALYQTEGNPVRYFSSCKNLTIAQPLNNKLAANREIGTTNLNLARQGHTATQLDDGRLLLIGGANENGPVGESEIYDPRTNSFSLAARLNTARTEHTALRLADGRILISGGRTQEGLLYSSEIYDPASGAFYAGPALNYARAGHTATALADGRVLIVGGETKGTAELFDPNTQSFVPIEANLSAPREAHAAVLLQNGKVLIAGGRTTDGTALLSAEIFDPVTLSFSATLNAMHAARTRPTLNLLPDGKVQVIGGDAEATMEMFNAAGGYFTAQVPLLDGSSLITKTLSVQMRAALIRNANSGAANAPGKLAGTLGDLFDRSDYSSSELPQTNQVLLAGGVNSEGRVLNSVLLLATSTATVTTDETDYAPGATVSISGTGWQPNETVRLTLHRNNGSADTVLFALADANGNFTNSQYVAQRGDLGITFLLTTESERQSNFTTSLSVQLNGDRQEGGISRASSTRSLRLR